MVLTVSMTTTSKYFCYLVKGELSHPSSFFAASIFAYGQTSSGKTYTMMGITEYTVADIFDYIQRV